MVFAVGTDVKRGRVWSRNGTRWKSLDNPFDVAYSAWAQSASDVYIAGMLRLDTGVEQGELFRYNGATFHEIAVRPHSMYNAVFGAGVSPDLIAAVLGHADSRMVERVYGRMPVDVLAHRLAVATGSVGLHAGVTNGGETAALATRGPEASKPKTLEKQQF